MIRQLGIPGLLLAVAACSDSTIPDAGPLDIPRDPAIREVPRVAVEHGPRPGEIVVSWWIVNWSTFPIEEYLVAVSSDGPITESNWSEARILGRHPRRKGQVTYRECYGETDGIVQGAATWIAVRARDAGDRLSRVLDSPRIHVTREWWIEGRVRDLSGSPVPGMVIRSPLTGQAAAADLSGAFRVGPLRSIDIIDLVTGAYPGGDFWYRVVRTSLRSRPGTDLVGGQDFILIERHDLDPYCRQPDNGFLTYLRNMTRTNARRGDPGSTILHRWEHYPLTVFIPDQVNGTGIALDQGADAALSLWNGAMGEDYFVRTERADEADIVFTYREMDNYYGLASLLSPAGPEVQLGRVIPDRMEVAVNPVLADLETVTEICLHELGHTLGLYDHADCSAPGYLMKIGGGFGALDRAAPIHADERRAVRTIRHLPQGQDMARYLTN